MPARIVPNQNSRRNKTSDRKQEFRSSPLRALSLLLGVSLLAACVTNDVPAADAAAVLSPPAATISLRRDIAAICSRPNAITLASVVRVASADGNDASGVVIASNRVLTAAHVVNSAGRALVYINDNYRDATVVARDNSTDLAILAVETDRLLPIQIADSDLLQREPVWTVGFPLALDQEANFGFYQHHVDGAIYASAGTNAGASGGGLLRCENGEFELAGMIRGYGAYWRGGELQRIEDLSISVPANTITDFASRSGVRLIARARL